MAVSTASRTAACSGAARPPARAQASTASIAARLMAEAGAASGRARQNAAAAAAASAGDETHSGHRSADAGGTVAAAAAAGAAADCMLCSRYAFASSPERVAATSGPAPVSSAAAAHGRQLLCIKQQSVTLTTAASLMHSVHGAVKSGAPARVSSVGSDIFLGRAAAGVGTFLKKKNHNFFLCACQ